MLKPHTQNRRKSINHAFDLHGQSNFKMIFQSAPIPLLLIDGSSLKTVFSSRDVLFHPKNVKRDGLLKSAFLEKVAHVPILGTNAAASDLFKASQRHLLDASFVDLFASKNINVLIQTLFSLIHEGSNVETEIQIETVKGKIYECILKMSVPKSYQKSFERLVVSLQDVSAIKRLERSLRRKSQLDGLTNVLNHDAILKRLNEEYHRARRYKLDLSCVMVDIDYFKLINDKLGHQKGDEILKKSAQLLKKSVRNTDIVGRYGGDEFFIILPETSVENARIPSLRIQENFKKKIAKGLQKVLFENTLSIGISGYPVSNVRNVKDLVQYADNAMYMAKSSGKDKVVLAQ